MAMSQHLSSYLRECGTRYEVCTHAHSRSSAESAQRANLMAGQVAKPVILEDEDGFVMAVIPADKRLALSELARLLDRPRLHLADERTLVRLFRDCEPGAIPPVGMPWGMETVVDDELEAGREVYMEAGDHERLLRVPREAFRQLMRSQRHGHICKEAMH
jgi:Ala-tRNA(Pro) deacylase